MRDMGDGAVEFGILGPMLVRVDGQPRTVTSTRLRVLLAALLVRANTIVPIDELAEMVWDGNPPPRARTTLYSYVTRLRQVHDGALADRISTVPPGYRMEVLPGELDLERFRSLHATGLAAMRAARWVDGARHLSAALALIRAEPLLDIPSQKLRRDIDDHVEELRAQALEWRAEAEHAQGGHSHTITELRELAAAHPYREAFAVQLMRALYNAGRQAEALAVYRATRLQLIEDLGTEPGLALRALHQQILSGGPTPLPAAPTIPPQADDDRPAGARPVPAQLPPDISDFTGRRDRVRQLCDLLAADGSALGARICAVTGAGGIGKTTLAVHVGHRLAAHFPDGQLYADLQGSGECPLHPVDVVGRLLRDLGTDAHAVPADAAERIGLFRTLLADRRVLIVLDDAGSAEQVRPLLPGRGGSRVLITGRRRLTDLESAHHLDLDVLSEADARALFASVVGEDRAAAEPEATIDILAACAGLPLAIRIAAARLAARSAWTVQYLADRIRDEHRRLDELRSGDVSVRAAFRISYAALDQDTPKDRPSGARAFRLLGLHEGWDISAAAAARLLERPLAATEDVLESLVDTHLLAVSGAGRYRLHDLLQLYAQERGEEEDCRDYRVAAVIRLLDWYLDRALAAARVLEPHRRHLLRYDEQFPTREQPFASIPQAMRWCEDERANVMAAILQAHRLGLHRRAWTLVAAQATFHNRRSYRSDWTKASEIALRSAEILEDGIGQGLALRDLGAIHTQHNEPEKAIGFLHRALEAFQGIGERRGEIQVRSLLGIACFQNGDHAGALEQLAAAVSASREIGDGYLEALSLHNQGEASRRTGDIEAAVAQLTRAIVLSRRLGIPSHEAHALVALGTIHFDEGRLDEAVDHLRSAVRVLDEIGNRPTQAATLDVLSRVLREAGQSQAGDEAQRKASEIRLALL